jgi:cell division protein FtsB
MPGSSAATAAPSRRTRPAPRTRRGAGSARLLRVRWDRVGRTALLIVLLAVFGLYIQQGVALLSVRSATHQQQADVARLRHENAQLSAQQQALENPASIQQDARALGMIRPGERPYVVTGLPGR